MALTLWHNPRCSTSRKALALLEERGITPDIRLYLTDPPTETELRAAIAALGRPAMALVRVKEPLWQETGLSAESPEGEIIAALVRHPILIERPLVLRDGRAVLGRPPEAVLEIL